MSDETKCFALTFLPSSFSLAIGTLFMVPVCIGNYYLNINLKEYLMNENDNDFIGSRAKIVQICAYVSFGIFIIGIFIHKYIFLLRQLTVVFLIYLLFSVACLICNTLYIAFTESFEYNAKMYWWATRKLVDEYQDLDDALAKKEETSTDGWKKIERYMRIKTYILLCVHFLIVLFMLYYYKLITSFTAEREKKDDFELQVHKSNHTSNISSMNTTNCGNTSTMNTNATLNNSNNVISDSQAV